MSIFDLALTPEQVEGEALQLLFVPLSAFDLERDLWNKNAKKHDMKALLESIDRHGFVDPPKWCKALNGGAGGFVFGNGRTTAIVSALIEAKRSGGEAPRGIPVSKETGEWCVPVKFGVDSVSENIAIGLAIDHNNLTMMGGDFDASDIASMWGETYIDLLKDLAEVELLPVSVLPIDLADLMMGVSELNPQTYDEPQEGRSGNSGNNGPTESEEDLEAIVDAAEEPEYIPRVKAGEIWKLGRHYIACGDCTIEGNVRSLMDASDCSKIDMVWADPPYGMNLDTSYANSKTNVQKNIVGSRGYQAVAGDNRDFDAGNLLNYFQAVEEQYWWGADYYRNTILPGGSWLVWNKRAGLPEFEYTSAAFELCWSKTSHARQIINIRWFGAFGMEQEGGQKRVHPTQKPIALARWFFEKYGKSNDVVIDPFLVSGMSLIAAEELGDRTVIGFELSNHYCSIICDRWEKLTGLKAEKVGDL